MRSPGLINEDPYGKGWLFKVRVPKLSCNLRNLLSGRLAQVWMEITVRALKRRMEGELGPVLQDGGVPVTGIGAPGRGHARVLVSAPVESLGYMLAS